MLDHVMSGHWVQCIGGGHSYELPVGDPLIERSKKRNHMDALILHEDECVYCREDRASQLRSEVRMCGDAGCPMGGNHCKNGCLAAKELRDWLYPPTGKLRVLKDARGNVRDRTRAARELGWIVRRITRGVREGKYLAYIECRDPLSNERVIVSRV